MVRRTVHRLSIFPVTLLVLLACSTFSPQPVIDDGRIRVAVSPAQGLEVTLIAAGGQVRLSDGTTPAFAFLVDSKRIPLFLKRGTAEFTCKSDDQFGTGRGIRLNFEPESGAGLDGVRLNVNLSVHDGMPGVVVGRATLHGLTAQVLGQVEGTSFYRMSVRSDLAGPSPSPHDLFLFQGAVYRWGKWYTKIKVTDDYSAANSTVKYGAQPEGGGLPLVYLWDRKAGLALAQIDTLPRVAAFPVEVNETGAVETSLDQRTQFLRPGPDGVLACLPVMIGAFSGDYYEAVHSYGRLLEKQGFHFAVAPPEAYESIWCGWGFDNKFVPADILRTLPAVAYLGIPMVGVDDGYQASFGDWPLIPEKFPRGEADMRALVDSIHAAGLKAQLWWVPMLLHERDPLFTEHPEWRILDSDGNAEPSAWHSVYLCPAWPPVVEHHRQLVHRFMQDWDYDAFKMDGGSIDMAPPCYNPAHHHARPEESCEAVAGLFRAIYEEAQKYKPGCVLQVCECGIPPSPYKMAWYNQQVTADPTSSDQVRARIKMYRALLGRSAAPFGDHVELSTGPDKGGEWRREHGPGKDFASTLAVGGVMGTKFTTLEGDDVVRTWDNNKGIRDHWKKWFDLQHKLKLYEGVYLNLYDIAWDVPETHVIAKEGSLYYGAFAEKFKGPLALKGLAEGKTYRLTDYENGADLGTVGGGAQAALQCDFQDHLLVKAEPLD
ncbi:MAG: alpha-galactosidase [Candidatus Glassbacteria bacterium]